MKKFLFTILLLLLPAFSFSDEEPYKVLVGPKQYITTNAVREIIMGIIDKYIDEGGIIRPEDSIYGIDYKLKIVPKNQETEE